VSGGMLLVVAIMVAIAALIIGIVLWSDLTYRRDEIPLVQQSSTSRPQRHPTPNLWYPPPNHTAPPQPPRVPEAHRIMQEHHGCRLDECPRKRAAYRVLVQAGHLTPPRLRSPRPSPERPQRHARR